MNISSIVVQTLPKNLEEVVKFMAHYQLGKSLSQEDVNKIVLFLYLYSSIITHHLLLIEICGSSSNVLFIL